MLKIGIIFLFLVFSSYSFAQEIHIEADNITYYEKQKLYIGEGHCVVKREDATLKADKIDLNKETGITHVKGNVEFHSGDDWIKGKKGTVNVNLWKGFIEDATLFLSRDFLWIKAKKIVILDKTHFYAENSALTSCFCENWLKGKGAHPKWTFHARKAYVVRDKYLKAYPLIFKTRGVPVFGLPYIYRNLNRKRRTGFLTPSFGYSSRGGFKYRQPFFLVLSDSQDATFTYNHAGRKGNGVDVEYRYFWTKDSFGQWHATFFKEKKPYGASDKKSLRYNVHVKHTQDLEKYGIIRSDINHLSDRNNYHVFKDDELSLTSERYVTSKLWWEWHKGEYKLSINNYYYEDLLSENNKRTLQKYPQFEASITEKKIPSTPFYLNTSTYLTRNYRKEGEKGWVYSLYPSLKAPFSIYQFSFLPEGKLYYDYSWWKDENGERHHKGRTIPEGIFTVSATLERIWFTNKESTEGIRHRIIPQISYDYIPYRDQSELPDFISRKSKENVLTFSLENRITQKKSGRYFDPLYVKFSQPFNINKKRLHQNPFEPFYIEGVYRPTDTFSFDWKAYYSTRKGLFTQSSENAHLNVGILKFSTGYVMNRDSGYLLSDESWSGRLDIYPQSGLNIFYSFEKNLRYGYFPQKRFGINYMEDCWGISLQTYINETMEENREGIKERKKNMGIWFMFTLKSIGSWGKRV